QRREASHPALVVRNDGLDARLLEHDLRDPDAVGVRLAAPRQVAAAGVVEGEEAVAQCIDEVGCHLRDRERSGAYGGSTPRDASTVPRDGPSRSTSRELGTRPRGWEELVTVVRPVNRGAREPWRRRVAEPAHRTRPSG